jgi:hypothetical protein
MLLHAACPMRCLISIGLLILFFDRFTGMFQTGVLLNQL